MDSMINNPSRRLSLQEAIRQRQWLSNVSDRIVRQPQTPDLPDLTATLRLPTSSPARSAYRRPWTRRQQRIALAAAAAIVIVIMLTTLLAKNVAYSQAAQKPLPVAKMDDVMDYLKSQGSSDMKITDEQVFANPNATWTASAEIQFGAQAGTDKGIFVLLTYPSSSRAGMDAFRATYNPKYQKWNLIQLSNFILLSPPETPDSLIKLVEDHLSHFLVGQYRPFLSTAKSG